MRIVIGYTGGYHPDRDRAGFVAALKARRPGITDYEIRYAHKEAVARFDQMHKKRQITLFGRDILTNDPTTIRSWELLPPSQQRRIMDHPIDRGDMVDPEDPKFSQLELARRLNRNSVHRSALISPEGLEETYCWRYQNDFQQDVTEHDFLLIRSFPAFKGMFQRIDTRGPVQKIQSYDMVPKERHVARDASDVQALLKEYERKNLHKGVTLIDGGN